MKARSQDTFVRLGIGGALLVLAACSGDANPVRDVAITTGVGSEPKPAPDFVASSRPESINYIPPGAPQAKTPAKTAAQVKAAEAAMEQARAANEGQAAAARALRSRPGPSVPTTSNP